MHRVAERSIIPLMLDEVRKQLLGDALRLGALRRIVRTEAAVRRTDLQRDVTLLARTQHGQRELPRGRRARILRCFERRREFLDRAGGTEDRLAVTVAVRFAERPSARTDDVVACPYLAMRRRVGEHVANHE